MVVSAIADTLLTSAVLSVGSPVAYGGRCSTCVLHVLSGANTCAC